MSKHARKELVEANGERSSTADQLESAQLFDCLVYGSRKQLRLLVGELVQQAPKSLVASLLQRATEIGAASAGPKSRFQQLPQTMFNSVFDFLTLGEKLTIVERVCRRWRMASLEGAGWRSVELPSISDTSMAAFCANLLAKSGRLQHTRVLDAEAYVGRDISWLKGLQLKELVLDVAGMKHDDLVPLLALASTLESLQLSGNDDFVSLAPLVGLEKLHTLTLHDTVVSSDLGPISSLPLKELDLQSCGSLEVDDLRVFQPTITDLSMPCTVLRGEGLAQLARFLSLKTLYLRWDSGEYWSQRDFDSFLELPCCKRQTLTSLSFGVISPSFDSLKKLGFLKELDISIDHPDDAFMRSLGDAPLGNIRQLALWRGPITDDGLQHASRFAFEELDFEHITDVGIGRLQQGRFTQLSIYKCPLLKGHTLSSLPNVQTLEIDSCPIAQNELRALANIKGLTSLTIRNMIKKRDREEFERLFKMQLKCSERSPRAPQPTLEIEPVLEDDEDG